MMVIQQTCSYIEQLITDLLFRETIAGHRAVKGEQRVMMQFSRNDGSQNSNDNVPIICTVSVYYTYRVHCN